MVQRWSEQVGIKSWGRYFLVYVIDLEHAIDGLSGKVLNERLTKLLRFGILDKASYAEVPPPVEYRMTAFGNKFTTLLDEVDQLQQTLDDAPK